MRKKGRPKMGTRSRMNLFGIRQKARAAARTAAAGSSLMAEAKAIFLGQKPAPFGH